MLNGLSILLRRGRKCNGNTGLLDVRNHDPPESMYQVWMYSTALSCMWAWRKRRSVSRE